MEKDIYREKAIKILEAISKRMGNETMFYHKNGKSLWYDLEDLITKIIKAN